MQSSPLPEEFDRTPFTYAAGRRAGLGEGRLRGRDLQRPFHGVRVSGELDTLIDLCLTYAARMSPHAFFCASTAALLHDIPIPGRLERDTRLHVAVPNPARAPRGEGVAGHKLDMPERHVVAVRGLRVASAEMAWCQLSSGLSVSELVVAGDRLLRNGDSLTTRERVRLTLEEYAGRRGRARLVTAFGLLDGGSESPGETRLRVILVDAGIRGFVLNHIVTTPDGRRFRVDFAFPELKVAIEYQGGYHADDAQWRADMTRIARLEAMGWRVIQVNNDDLRDTRELVLRIRSTLTRRTT